MTRSKEKDFNFLLGDWQVQNKRLKACLADSDDWIEFPATLEGSRALLHGFVIIEQYIAEFDGEPFEGVSIRMYNPETEQWTIYWMDTNRHEMVKQVVGAFKDETGEFCGYGEELYMGKPVKMRFIWKDITATSARWEQAYFDEARGAWETNWIMEFTRSVE